MFGFEGAGGAEFASPFRGAGRGGWAMTNINTHAWREIIEAGKTQGGRATAWGCSWGIHAPWAHPAWHQYALHLYDLLSPTGQPPTLHLPGATHEFLLYAISPDTPLVVGTPLSGQEFQHLHPANYGYQFRATSNKAALSRLQAVVDEIVAGRLSPDTDFRDRWNQMMQDAFPLVSSGLAEAFGGPSKTDA